jgi:hypothetical protein
MTSPLIPIVTVDVAVLVVLVIWYFRSPPHVREAVRGFPKLVVDVLKNCRNVSGKQEAIFNAAQVPGAIIREKCMIRDGFMECPGVAVVVNDTLILHSVLRGERRLPLSQITLTKETIGLGSYPWWGKRVFLLKAPGTFRLAIGVKNSEPWRHLFRQTLGT